MRTFEKFPENVICPICKTNDDLPCFLMTIDGTEDGGNVEAAPTHVGCLQMDGYRYNKANGIIYCFIE